MVCNYDNINFVFLYIDVISTVFHFQIRKQAVKDLPSLCKENKKHVRKIADILAQLLQVGDTSELSVVHNSLMTLFKLDAKGVLWRKLFASYA